MDEPHWPGPRLNRTGIDWLIVGGESGPRYRAIDPQWVRDLRDACRRDHQDVVGLTRPHDRFPGSPWSYAESRRGDSNP